MGDSLKKVQPGEKLHIPARAYNAFIETAMAVQGRQMDRAGDALPAGRGNGAILVQNASGSTCARFGVLALSEPIIAPGDNADDFQNRIGLKGTTPEASDVGTGRFAVLMEPLADQEIGRAVVSGPCAVKLNVIDQDHRFADVSADDTTRLESCPRGPALILWKESGTSEKWAIVNLANPPVVTPPFPVKLTEVVSKGIYRGIEQQYGAQGWEDKPDTDPIECHNAFEALDPDSSALLVDDDHHPLVLVCQVGGVYVFERSTNALYRQEEPE